MENKSKWQKVVLAVAALLAAIFGGTQLGGYQTNQPERISFTTSTSANTSDIVWHNVQDFESIGVTVNATADSGQFRVACSMQDTSPTLAATSTSNRWDYVDFIDTTTESSIDGYTGITFTSSTAIRQLAIRNSVWKWCVPTFTASVDLTAGVGTTTAYVKPMDNQ